jgi:hypothetical protein
MGWIEYKDKLGTTHRTSFCRLYAIESGQRYARFYPVDDPDYEHEE